MREIIKPNAPVISSFTVQYSQLPTMPGQQHARFSLVDVIAHAMERKIK